MIKTWTHENGRKIKLFISQPYTGQNPEDIKESRESIYRLMKYVFGESKVELLNQFDMDDPYDIDENFSCEEQREAYRFCRSIGIMKDADIVIMYGDWKNSRGCTIEHLIAEKYNIPTLDILKDAVTNSALIKDLHAHHLKVISDSLSKPGIIEIPENNKEFEYGDNALCVNIHNSKIYFKILKVVKRNNADAFISSDDGEELCLDIIDDLCVIKIKDHEDNISKESIQDTKIPKTKINKLETFTVGVYSTNDKSYQPGYLYVGEENTQFTDDETVKCFHYPCNNLVIKELKVRKLTFLKQSCAIISSIDASDIGLDFGYDTIFIIKENNKSVKDIIYDVMFKHIKPKFDKIDELNGYWAYGSNPGLCCWGLSYSASGNGRSLGSCLFKDEKCWKIYNGSENGSGFDKYYNIIVHFNDNDKITNVEWVDDSIFEVFDKEFMYSIYEDLKKYEISKSSKDDTEEFDEPTDEEINETIEGCYPFCIIKDRHSGTYSGGEYTAWACGIDFIPEGIFGDDFDCVGICACAGAWEKLRRQRKNGEIVYGVGNTPDEAAKDLARAIIINNKKNEEDEE